MAMKGIENAPDWWEGAKEWTFETYEDVETWLRVRGMFTSEILASNFFAAMKGLQELGIVIREETPGVLKLITSGTIEISASVLRKIKDTHDYLITLPPEMNYVEAFEIWALDTLGFDVKKELTLDQARNQFGIEEAAVVGIWNGGNYPISSVTERVSKSPAIGVSRSKKLMIVDAAGDSLSSADVKAEMDTHMRALAKSIYGDKNVPDTGDLEDSLSPAQLRFVLEALQANLFRNVGLDGQIKARVIEYNKLVAKLEKEEDKLVKEVKQVLSTIRDVDTGIAKIEGDYELAWTEKETTITSKIATETSARDSAFIAYERASKTLDTLNKVNVKKMSRGEKVLHDLKYKAAESDLKAKEKLYRKHSNNLEKLVVYRRIAELATRTPAEAGKITFTAADLQAATNPALHGNAGVMTKRDAVLKQILADSISMHTEYTDLIKEKGILDKSFADLGIDLNKVKSQLAKLKSDGVEPVVINKATLFGGIVETSLRSSVAARGDSILSNAFAEDYNINEIVPLGWLFGDAREAAEANARAWKVNRMKYDKTLQAYKKQGKDPEVLSAYERYLDHVALGEIFMRAMLESPDGGEKEAQSPLHLSVSEARNLDEFLKEREGLISFAQFLEVWEKIPAANRRNVAP
jgi:hypothetical protein